MLIYTFDENGIFIGTSTAQKHPLKAGFLYPKNSTLAALPNTNLEAYQAFKFDGSNWAVENVQEKVDDLLATTNDKGTLLYEDIGGLPIARDIALVITDDAEADKVGLRQVTYDSMQIDIYDELEILYLTRKAETATAISLTWDIMQNNPAEYSAMGLISEYNLVGIFIGDPLDTEAKILDYATQLNAKKLVYSKYRLTRIMQYKQEIIAIG